MSDDFEEEVTRAFQFLTLLDYKQMSKTEDIVKYKKSNIEVSISIDRLKHELAFSVGPVPEIYSLSELIRYLDPAQAQDYRDPVVTDRQRIRPAVEQLAGLARKYGQHALSGRSAFFAEMARLRIQWQADYALDVLKSKLKPEADAAFRNRQYDLAAELYGRMKSVLGDADLKKLEISKKKSRQ